MQVRKTTANLIPTIVSMEQRQMLDELAIQMDLPVRTVGRVLVTAALADVSLRSRVVSETDQQKGRRFKSASERSVFQVLVDDHTYALVGTMMNSIGVRSGVVVRAALIVASAELPQFLGALHREAQTRSAASIRGQEHHMKAAARTIHEVQA